MKKLHYGWLVCLACTILQFVVIGMLVPAFSVYTPYLMDAYSFTNTQVNLISTIRTLFGLLAKLAAVPLIAKLDTRKTAALAGVLGTLAFGFYSVSTSLAGYYTAAALAGAANGLGGMILASIILHRWFRTSLALTLGICASGSGIATIILPPVITASIEISGLRLTFIAETAAVAVLSALVVLILRNTPADKGLAPYCGASTGEKTAARAAAALRPLDRYLLYTAPFLVGVTSLTCTAILPLYYRSEGYDALSSALAMSIYGVFLLLGKFLFGLVNELIGGRRGNALFLSIGVLGYLCACAARVSLPVMLLSAALIGLGSGLPTVGLSVWCRDLVPPDQFDRTVGRFQIIYSLGGLLFSTVPGPVADAAGSYLPVFIIYTAATALMMLIVCRTYHLAFNK